MIKFLNITNFIYRTYHFREQCRILSCALSTAHCVCQREKLNKPTLSTGKLEVVNESPRNYEDTFGNFESFEMKFQKIKEDPEDVVEYMREKAGPGLTMPQYIQEIKNYLNEHDYKSAKKLVEVDMVNDKKPLVTLVYKILVNYNAKIGNVDEAYKIYLQYRRRGGITVGAMYTSLFNACANCKNSKLALEKANAVAECMRNNKNHTINASNYNAMLKAYGRHGDISTCLKIMDEIYDRRDKVHNETYNFLFQACISDNNSGLRLALIVWRKMLQYNVKPNIYSFNLMLRCVKDCSLGDALGINTLIDDIKKESEVFFKRKVIWQKIDNETKRKVLKIPITVNDPNTLVESQSSESVKAAERNSIMLESSDTNQSKHLLFESSAKIDTSQTEIKNSENVLSDLVSNKIEDNSSQAVEDFSSKQSLVKVEELMNSEGFEFPNLLAKKISTGAVLKFDVITKPEHRFLLLGGVKGFLEVMNEFKVKPDIKTFSLMLALLPPNLEVEKDLMSLMEKYKIKFDTAFFNILIKRRIIRYETFTVRPALEMMFSLDLKPSITTFGILAISCSTLESANDLLRTLGNYGFRANSVILETLLRKAAFANDINYVYAILQKAKEDEVELSPGFVAQLSNFVQRESRLRKGNLKKQLKEPEDEKETSSQLKDEQNECRKSEEFVPFSSKCNL